MSVEDYEKLKENIEQMPVEPPTWNANVESLKMWLQGFEACQEQIIYMINARIKALSEAK